MPVKDKREPMPEALREFLDDIQLGESEYRILTEHGPEYEREIARAVTGALAGICLRIWDEWIERAEAVAGGRPLTDGERELIGQGIIFLAETLFGAIDKDALIDWRAIKKVYEGGR